MAGKIYIVPTPVGNLEDMTYRSVQILKESDVIYCEDTRHSLGLLNYFGIDKPLKSFHKFNERMRVDEIKKKVLDGEIVSVISDAGTPGISDPVNILTELINEKYISTLPGATAFVPALVNSGLDTSRFIFIGFLPSKKSERVKLLQKLKDITETMIFYESPHRIQECLLDMAEVFGARRASISREISKLYEENIRFCLGDDLSEIRGEIVIVVEGAEEKEIDFREIVDPLIEAGETAKSIIKFIKEKGIDVPRNEVYEYILESSKGDNYER